MRSSVRWAAALVLLAGCASDRASRAPASPELPLAIHWVRNSAEYRALLEPTYRLATEALEEEVAGREPGSWAVALDADETLISNSEASRRQALAERPEPFEEWWDEWVERREAPALPGTLAFLARVRELGGHIAVVTNRSERHCPQTADNLRAIDISFDVLLCRGDDSEKEPRWERITAGEAGEELPPVEIVMWLGDNIKDFPGLDQELRFADPQAFAEFGRRYFILPNPLYGSWEDNPPD